MGIFDRIRQLVKSNVNDALDKVEDPSKLIDQTLREAREDLAQVRKETAGVMADARRAEREYAECAQQVQEYTIAAQNALKAGKEEDARTLLAQKQVQETNLLSLQQAKEVTQSNAIKLQQTHDKLVRDISTLESKRSAIKATVATAKAQEHINDVMAGGDKAKASLETFTRMEEKATSMLDAATAEAELVNDTMQSDTLLAQYAGESGDTVDEELERMKVELGLS